MADRDEETQYLSHLISC